MKYAVIEIGSRQYLVEPGDKLTVDRLSAKAGEKIVFDKVLLVADSEKEVAFGRPYLEGLTVTANVLTVGKGKKVRVATYKAKSRSRRVVGFRPSETTLEILAIVPAVKSRSMVKKSKEVSAKK